jgi:probable HAF family extracellular repeat protein
MFRRDRSTIGFLAATLLLIAGCADDATAPSSAAASTAYSARSVTTLEPIDLGTIEGFTYGLSSEAHAINSSGGIAGWGEPRGLYGMFGVHAILWRDGAPIDLGALGGTLSRAWGINDDGVVVGSATTTGDYSRHAFVWRDGVMTDLGLGGSDAFGIDPTGRIVGKSDAFTGAFHAYLWDQGAVTDLGTLGGNTSVAYAISPSGVIVGSSVTAAGAEHAFRWRKGVLADLGTLGGTKSVAHAVNPAGDVVGSSTTVTGEEHAVLWPKRGGIVDLGTLGRASSVAMGINPSGQIVGYFTGFRSSGAFIWQHGVMSELPGVLHAMDGMTGEGVPHAYGINAAGEVVGDGLTDYRPHAALWTWK